MNDSQSIVEILIKFGLLDAQNADTALQKLQLIDEQQRSGMLNTLKMADATKELGQAEEAGAGAAELMHINHRALHQILHLIGHVAGPEAGAALAGIASASGMGIMGGVMAAQMLLQWIEKLKKGVEELNDAMANFDVSRWNAQMDAANAAAESVFRFKQNIEDSGKAVDAVTEKYKAQDLVIQAILKNNAAILEQMEKMELAAAKARDASPTEIDAIKQRYEAEKSASKVAEEARQINEKSTEEKEREANATALKSKATADESALADAIGSPSAAGDKAELESRKGEQKKKLEAAYKTAGVDFTQQDIDRGAVDQSAAVASIKAKIAEMKAEHDAMPDLVMGFNNSPVQNTAKETLDSNINKARDALASFTDNAAKIDALNNSVEAHNQLVSTLTEAAKKSTEAYDQNRDAITGLKEAIKNLQTVLDVDKQGEGIKGRLEEFSHAQTAADQYTHTGKLDSNSAQFIIVLTQAITGQKQTLDSAAKLVEGMGGNMNTTIDILESHSSQLDTVNSRLKYLEEHHGG